MNNPNITVDTRLPMSRIKFIASTSTYAIVSMLFNSLQSYKAAFYRICESYHGPFIKVDIKILIRKTILSMFPRNVNVENYSVFYINVV